MRKISRLVLVMAVALGVFASLGSPAWAGTGGGTVSGTVGTSPGIDMTPRNQSITFAGIVISGSFNSNDSSKQFVGTVTVTGVTASGVNEQTAMGSGTVNPFTFDDGTGAVGNISNGTCKGTYQRVGSIVVVPLTCSAKISGSQFNGTVTVVAQFTPTKGDGITTRITEANFTGAYTVV